MTEGHMYHVTKRFIREITESEEFREYEMQLAKIKGQPELYARTNEFRQKIYEIQNMEDGDNYMERQEELEKEFADIREIPLVDDFLAAELCFCRMMQEIYAMISEEIDFQ